MTTFLLVKNQLQPIFKVLHVTSQSIYLAVVGRLVVAGNSTPHMSDFDRFPLTTDLGDLSISTHYTIGDFSAIVYEVTKDVAKSIVMDSGPGFLLNVSLIWEWIFRVPMLAWKGAVLFHYVLLALPVVNVIYGLFLIIGLATLSYKITTVSQIMLRGLRIGLDSFLSYLSFVVVSIFQVQKEAFVSFLGYLKDKLLEYLGGSFPRLLTFFEKVVNFIKSWFSVFTDQVHKVGVQIKRFFDFLESVLTSAGNLEGFFNRLKFLYSSLKKWPILKKGFKDKKSLNSEELKLFNNYRVAQFKSTEYSLDSEFLKNLKDLSDEQIL